MTLHPQGPRRPSGFVCHRMAQTPVWPWVLGQGAAKIPNQKSQGSSIPPAPPRDVPGAADFRHRDRSGCGLAGTQHGAVGFGSKFRAREANAGSVPAHFLWGVPQVAELSLTQELKSPKASAAPQDPLRPLPRVLWVLCVAAGGRRILSCPGVIGLSPFSSNG